MANVFGIDLGTTYSCIAKCDENEHIETIKPIGEYASDDTSIPSVVSFEEDGTPIVGKDAKENLKYPDTAIRTIDYFKRYMGEDYCPKEILLGDCKRKVSPIEGSACILRSLISNIPQEYKNEKPKAVITIPASYNNDQRQFVKNAARLAGIDVLGLIHEPTAAAIYYGMNSGDTVLVFDLGGGTLDVSVVNRDKEKYEVLAFASDISTTGRHIGGIDWDEVIIDLAVNKARWERHKNDIEAEGWNKEFAEKCKRSFSNKIVQKTRFPNVNKKSEYVEIEYNEFVQMSNTLLDDCMKVVWAAIKEADKKNNGAIRIDRCIMAGGSSNLRMIKSRLSKELAERIGLGRNEDEWLKKVDHPEKAIAEGAAKYAYRLEHKKDDKGIYIEERSSHSYGTSAIEDGKNKIINLVLSSDPFIITSKKSVKFKPLKGQGKLVYFDIWENEFSDNSYIYQYIKKEGNQYLCYNNIDKQPIARRIFNKPYETEREDSHVQLYVSRDKDGIISIEVEENNKRKKFQVMPAISTEIIDQIKKSLELLDKKTER